MAIINTPYASKLKISYDLGLGDDGKNIKKTKTYSDMKDAAVDQDVFDVASAITGLQDDTVLKIARLDESELSFE